MGGMRARLLAAAALCAALSACGGDAALQVAPPSAYGTPNQPAAPSAPVPAAVSPAAGSEIDPQISAALIQLAEERRSFRRDLAGAQGQPIGDLLAVGSPVGFTLRNRFLNLGIPLAEAFARNPDPAFRAQLLELSRWDRDGESRANALIALARTGELKYLQVFNEALIHLDPAVRFGALEALVAWGHPREAMPLLAAASERDTEPLLRVYASAGLARLGDSAGLHRLRAFLDSPSWLVRAMAAKYIGDLGEAQDYDDLLGRVDREVGNDFVVAEYCVSALKLYPKKKAARR
jgi:HEAT repeat protein